MEERCWWLDWFSLQESLAQRPGTCCPGQLPAHLGAQLLQNPSSCSQLGGRCGRAAPCAPLDCEQPVLALSRSDLPGPGAAVCAALIQPRSGQEAPLTQTPSLVSEVPVIPQGSQQAWRHPDSHGRAGVPILRCPGTMASSGVLLARGSAIAQWVSG